MEGGDPFDLKPEVYELSNGLDVILYEDHRIPMAAVNVWYHVGSKNEKPGRTGFAHLFEHMMFQGSEHHDTDYFMPLEKVGSFVNGSTSEDRTNYLENVPSNYVETALWLEADRMGFLLPAMIQERLDNQREVVMNERRERYDNQPYGKADELMLEMLYPSDHPYHHSVIGRMHDIEVATLDDVKGFFEDFYTPNNASLCVVGDFDTDEVRMMIDKYFGPIPPGPPVDRIHSWVPRMTSPKRSVAEDAVSLPRLYMAWHTPAWLTQEDATCDLIASILGSGKTSRLYQELVYERQIAQDVSVYQDSRELSSLFFIQVTAKEGHGLDEIEAAVDEVLHTFLKKGIRGAELERAQAAWEAGFVRALQSIGGFGGLADRFNRYNVLLGRPDKIAWDRERYRAPSVKDVMACARQYLDLERRAILHIVPKGDLQASAVEVDRSVMPSPGPDPEFEPPEIQQTALDNGLEVYLVEDHRLPLVQANLIVKSGWAADPPERPGAGALTAALIDEGTRHRSALEISEDLREIGANFGTFGGFDASGMNLNVLRVHLDEGLELMTDVLLDPTFPEEELERLRREYLGRIQQENSQPATAGLKVFQRILFGADHPYGQPYTGNGTAASIEALTRQDLLDYYAQNYRPNNAALVFVGDLTLAEAEERAQEHFGDWERADVPGHTVPPVPALPATRVCIVDRPDSPSSMIVVGNESVARSDPDYLATSVMSNALGGSFIARLNMNLREDKGYTYGAYTLLIAMGGAGALLGYAQVEADVTTDAVQEMVKEFREIRDVRPLDDEELVDCKNQMIRGFPQQFQFLGGIAGQLGQILSNDLPLSEWRTYIDRVAAIDGPTATRAAREQLHPDRMLIVVVGDRETIEPGLQGLGLGEIEVLSQEDLKAAL